MYNLETLKSKIIKINDKLKDDGVILDGVFGSYARGDAKDDSDIDILYHLEDKFFKKYQGFIGFKKLDEIKQIVSNELKLKVDFAPKNNLTLVGKHYILKDIIYV